MKAAFWVQGLPSWHHVVIYLSNSHCCCHHWNPCLLLQRVETTWLSRDQKWKIGGNHVAFQNRISFLPQVPYWTEQTWDLYNQCFKDCWEGKWCLDMLGWIKYITTINFTYIFLHFFKMWLQENWKLQIWLTLWLPLGFYWTVMFKVWSVEQQYRHPWESIRNAVSSLHPWPTKSQSAF